MSLFVIPHETQLRSPVDPSRRSPLVESSPQVVLPARALLRLYRFHSVALSVPSTSDCVALQRQPQTGHLQVPFHDLNHGLLILRAASDKLGRAVPLRTDALSSPDVRL